MSKSIGGFWDVVDVAAAVAVAFVATSFPLFVVLFVSGATESLNPRKASKSERERLIEEEN